MIERNLSGARAALVWTAVACMSVAGRGAAAAEQPKDVNVVNTPTVNVGNTPTVNVNGTVAVEVQNQPLQVRSAGPMELYHSAATVSIAANVQNGFGALAAVPAGKRLVIEYVSAVSTVASDQNINRVSLTTTHSTGGGSTSSVRHQFPVTDEGDAAVAGNHVFSAGGATRLYCDAGESPQAGAFRGGNVTAPATVSVTVSGYLVDAP